MILNHRYQILWHNNETCVSIPAVEDMTFSVSFFFFSLFYSFLEKYVFFLCTIWLDLCWVFSVAQILRLGSWEPLISVGLGQKHTRACTHTIRQTHTHSNTQTQWRAWLAGEALSPLHSGSPLSGLSRQLRTGWKQPKLRKKSLSVLSFLIIAAQQSKLSQIFWAYGYYVFIHINLYEQISPYECRIWRKVAGFWGRGCSGQSSIDQSRLSGLWLHAGEQRKRGARRLKCDLGTLQLMSDDDLRFLFAFSSSQLHPSSQLKVA